MIRVTNTTDWAVASYVDLLTEEDSAILIGP